MTTETSPNAEDAYSSLPDDVAWSCSFGYPGDGGFRDHYRTPAGARYIISNGAWDDFEPRVWTVERIS